MIEHDIEVGLNVPVRVLICEQPHPSGLDSNDETAAKPEPEPQLKDEIGSRPR